MSMPSVLPTDPYTWVLQKLWELLESKATFVNLVPEANRIKQWVDFYSDGTAQSKSRRPMKDQVTESDLPEVMIFPSNSRFWEEQDSSGASIHKVYSIMVSSGSQLVNGEPVDTKTGMFDVEWAITRALYDFDKALEWEWENPDTGQTWKPIRRITIMTAEEALTNPELNRGIKGFTAVWSADVMLYFGTDILRGG